MIKVRKGQAPPPHSRAEFGEQFRRAYFDPEFRTEQAALDRLEAIAWDGYKEHRKAPLTRKAGPGFADPDYDTSIEWLQTRERLLAAAARQADPATAPRALLICGAPRNEGSCPGEMSKAVQEEVRNVARALAEAVGQLRAGRLSAPGAGLAAPRPK